MVRSFDELLKVAASVGPKRIAVAAANDAQTIAACVEAAERGVADSILVGDREWIALILEKTGADPGGVEVWHEPDPVLASEVAVNAVRSGEAEVLMKGNVATSKFVQAALSAAGGLRTDRLLSDVEVYEDTRGPGCRLVLVSDGGINIAPNIKQKLEIIRNAVEVAHRLGIDNPKVALLSGSEKVHPDFQSTIDAIALVKMCQYGDVRGCVVDGPFGLDNAIDRVSARAKGIESPVGGAAEVLIVPNLETGNIFCKGLQYYAGKTLAHVGVGAKAPVLIDSRTAPAEAKLASIALAVMMCQEPAR
ncbi:MAG: phosphate acyltransferase [Thermodesulfobacteriota bacterium]